ncbi:MAG: hypothetical protein Q9195_001220 [Heterodermia aff. obscurata]
MLLEKDDARRARGVKKKSVVTSKKGVEVLKKTLESDEAVEPVYDDGLLAIGPDVFEHNRVGNMAEVEGVKVAATTGDGEIDELTHIGPEVFKDDRIGEMGFGNGRLDANVPAGVATSTQSKEISVEHWMDDMEATENNGSDSGWRSAIGAGYYNPHHRPTSSAVESSADDTAVEANVVSGYENSDGVDSSDDDAETVITAIEFPMTILDALDKPDVLA